MGLSPEEFVSVIDQRGLLGGSISMPPQAASSPASHASPNVQVRGVPSLVGVHGSPTVEVQPAEETTTTTTITTTQTASSRTGGNKDAEARPRADAEELRRLEEARESKRLADESAAEEERLRTAARQREAFEAAEERRREHEARIAAEEQIIAAVEGEEQEAEMSVAVESETSVLSRSVVVEEGPLAALKQKLRAYEQEFAKTAPTVPLSSSSVRVGRSPAPATGPTPGATPMDPGVVDASPAVAALSPGERQSVLCGVVPCCVLMYLFILCRHRCARLDPTDRLDGRRRAASSPGGARDHFRGDNPSALSRPGTDAQAVSVSCRLHPCVSILSRSLAVPDAALAAQTSRHVRRLHQQRPARSAHAPAACRRIANHDGSRAGFRLISALARRGPASHCGAGFLRPGCRSRHSLAHCASRALNFVHPTSAELGLGWAPGLGVSWTGAPGF
jgi:hypothetical protein